jgi:PleD family two-component response regulator
MPDAETAAGDRHVRTERMRVPQSEPQNLLTQTADTTLAEILPSRVGRRARSGAVRGRVLVVDDMAANCALVTALFTRDGYEVSTEAGGGEALEIARREHPDLVLRSTSPRRHHAAA